MARGAPWRQLLLLLLLLLPAARARGAPAITFSVRPRADLDAMFTPRPGWSWLGGDSSASVRIVSDPNPPGAPTMLWLFGATLLGTLVGGPGRLRRNITSMPHSTLAITKNMTGPPVFLDPPTSRGWFYPRPGAAAPATAYYWIIDGIQSTRTNALFIVAMVIENTKDGGFVQLGSDLIAVPRIAQQFQKKEPATWTWNSTRIPFSGGNCSWNEGLALEAGYLYMLGSCNQEARIARVTEDDAATLALRGGGGVSLVQFWSGAGDAGEGWVADGRRAVALFASPFSEGTLKYNALIGWHVFLCQAFDAQIRVAYTGPLGQLSNGGVLEGEGAGWAVVPVMTVPLVRRSGGAFSYAAKAHPELALDDGNASQLIFSYNTNVGPGVNALVNNTWAYHPTFVQVDISV